MDESIVNLSMPRLREVVEGRIGDAEGGKYVRLAESVLSDRVGSQCVLVSNGTLALVMALLVAGIKAGDRVIVPANGFLADAAAVSLLGATPVFADVDPRWLVPESLPHIPGARAAIFVHIAAWHSCVADIAVQCRKRRLFLIEDCSHIVGAPGVGTYGDVAVGSFFASKVLTCGEGGVLWSWRSDVIRRLRAMRNHGRRRDFAPASMLGLNGRMSELQAAVLCSVLECADDLLARREQVLDVYRAGLSGWPEAGQRGTGYKYVLEHGAKREQVWRDAGLAIGGAVYRNPLPAEAPWYESKWAEQYPGARKGCAEHVCLRTDISVETAELTVAGIKEKVEHG